MAAEQLKIFTAKKETLFRRVQTIYDASLDVTTDAKIRTFKIRYEGLEKTSEEFREVMDSINVTQLKLDKAFVPSYAALDSFEELCNHVTFIAKQLAEKERLAATPLVAPAPASAPRSLPRLPKLELPTFTGDMSQWPIFYQCFKSMIHDNKELNDTDRVHYLIGQLKGSALAICSGIPPVSENYAILWKTLVDKYQDERVLASSYLKQILEFKPAQSESVIQLNAFIEKFDTAVVALKTLTIPDLSDFILAYLALSKLDPETSRLFENSKRENSIPKYEHIVKFAKEQAKILSRSRPCNNSSSSSNKSNQGNYSSSNKSKIGSTFMINNSSSNQKCPICNQNDHNAAYRCTKFTKLSPYERYQCVIQKHLCLNCLSDRHLIASCNSKSSCASCKLKHHSLLHFDKQFGKSQGSTVQPVATINEVRSLPTTSSNLENSCVSHSLCSTAPCYSLQQNSTVLLATAIVDILDCNGEKQQARFILDSASQAHLLTASCRNRLGLPSSKFYSSISGVGLNSNPVHGQTDIVFTSRYDSSKSYCINALIVNKITNQLPSASINTESQQCFKKLPLADESYHQPGPIDGIIGAQLFPHLVFSGRVRTSQASPIAVETSLGYVVMGCAPLLSTVDKPQTFCTMVEVEPAMESLIKRFWELEEVTAPVVLDPEDVECEKLFTTTVSREPTGRYAVALPFNKQPSNLGDSYSFAYKRFLSLEKRLKASPDLKLEYDQIIQGYLDQGHMSVVKDRDPTLPSYYIPHHPIFKASASTPVRAVFDASMKSTSAFSLNDLLYTGPKLQTDMRTVLLNFRLFSVAMCADIRQMYRQILVTEEHRRYQRLLWRFSPEKPLVTLQLNTVTFGVKSSPYLALRVIKQLVLDEARTHPIATRIIPRDLYVDDLVTSVDNIDDAQALYRDAVDLFKSGGFELVKWSSNSETLMESISPQDRLIDQVQFEVDTLKVLGLQWNPRRDILSFHVNTTKENCSKRIILSTIARCYDPLGLLSPVILYAKMLVKDLWSIQLQWDDQPPAHIVEKWSQFVGELPLLVNFQIPRHVSVYLNCPTILVAFADASEKGYGGVVYLQTITPSNQVKVTLLCAKSKVSPTKTISIPRLELCAAHLLSKLINFVVTTYSDRIPIIDTFAFSDSTVVLCWLNSSPSRWGTFVANRVTKVTELVPKQKWFHIDSESNPADCISRGLTPSELLRHSLWLNGPSWLHTKKGQWPIQPFDSGGTSTSLEQKLVAFPIVGKDFNSMYELVGRISTWRRLIRATVYVLRFIRILPRENWIPSKQLEIAELAIIKVVQSIHFEEDILLLTSNKECSSSLRKLRPFLKDGLLRVGGRLGNSTDLTYDQQHPLLLPKGDPLVNLLIDHYHQSNLHTGPFLVSALIRQKYWILAGRGVIRNRIQACNYCFKFKPKPTFPLMADLPACRVAQSKAFCHTGVDYLGPFNITFSRKRGIQSQKAYICLFICLSTKAVHLELVSSLSTPHFLQAFKRFLSRRGYCACLYSDQGTNFVGAKSHLNELYKMVMSKEYNELIGDELASRKIDWKFNVPAAPHFGGIWEGNVRSVKTHLYKGLNSQLLSYEELTTLLTQIEALLNSRPLCVLSSDPTAPTALTPAHFLTLSPVQNIPAPNLVSEPINRLDRFQLIDRMVQDFWHRWRLEYLTTMQVREKWNTPSVPITPGMVVVIRQDGVPPLKWPLGIIEEVFSSKDGTVRVVSVRTKQGLFKRPTVKVCPLPTQ